MEDIDPLSVTDSSKINSFMQGADDVIDLLILEELNQKFVEGNIQGGTINNLTSFQAVIRVLENFHNASKRSHKKDEKAMKRLK